MNPWARAGDERCGAWLRERFPTSILIVVALLIAVLGVAPAQANGLSDHSHETSSALPVAVLFLGAVGFGLATMLRRFRPAALLLLALLIGWFGVELAVHSIHHVGDPKSAESCAFFLASQHAEGASTSPVVTGAPTRTVEPSPTLDGQEIPLPREFCSHEGRAPPVPPSA
ncbi:MAG TPA: hypothetical protein VMS64_29820 [Candidatus Methylomirabilis sp.]|nr:hypothetical protein [Candidatus Methylomirabilis sp.]